ncbi:hypothetical protein D9613_012117 [Agrocybe pediades]|uniref:LYC1 C-terminal domain-containing protein n=1 Tax=Agrocybe pediades TaxID=84607 RepID=A0A8H4R218_9AGAR|nr:hypothetical protein D9613_012117 [Agrocybe pediades]
MSPFEWRPPLGYSMTAFNLVILWMRIEKLNLGGFRRQDHVPNYIHAQSIPSVVASNQSTPSSRHYKASIQEPFFRPFLMSGIESRSCNLRVFLDILTNLNGHRRSGVKSPLFLEQSKRKAMEETRSSVLCGATWTRISMRDTVPAFGREEVDDAHSSTVPGEWEWLNEQEVHDIWKEESERMKLELEERARESQTSICTFLPGNGVADFLIDRKRMGWMRMEYVPKYWGIRHSTAGLDQFSTWTIERRKDGSWVMVITRLRGDAERIIQEIIAEFAKKHGVSIIEYWRVGDTERDDHLPCFKWYDPERSTSCFNENVQDGFTSTAAFRYSWPQPKRD